MIDAAEHSTTSADTPCHSVPNFGHLVAQRSAGRLQGARQAMPSGLPDPDMPRRGSCSHGQLPVVLPDARGLADSAGNPAVAYCPGGFVPSDGLWSWNPREMRAILASSPSLFV